MTRGIRKGVKETENVLKDASGRTDIFDGQRLEELQNKQKEYKIAVKPTLDTLDALDGYLEALNALAQANKKSGENAKALVDSVKQSGYCRIGYSISEFSN